MMLRSIVTFLIVVIACSGLQAQQFPISFSESVWDMGSIPKGGLKNKTIKVTNVSDAPVGMYQFNPLNPYLSARARKTLLQPGESTEVHLQFQAGVPQGNFESKIQLTLIGDKRTGEIMVKALVTEAPPLGVGKIKPDTTGIPVIRVGEPDLKNK